MKLIVLEVLLNPEWEKEHEFEMLLKYRWVVPFCQMKMRKPSKSNHNYSGEITSVAHYNSPFQEISPECDRLFYPEVPHISNKVTVHVHEAKIQVHGVMKKEHTMQYYQSDAQLECLFWMTCCTYSDLVKWISGFSCKTNLCWSVKLDKKLLSKRLKVRKKRLGEEACERERRESEGGWETWQKEK